MVLLAVGRNTETSKTVYCLSQLLALAQVSFKVKNHKHTKQKQTPSSVFAISFLNTLLQ